MISRRDFLGRTAVAFAGLHSFTFAGAVGREIHPLGALVKDPKGLLDLPQGFRYKVISEMGTRMADGFLVPGSPDGMAAFPGPDGKVVLVCNHELSPKMVGKGPFDDDLTYPDSLDIGLSHDAGVGGKEPQIGGTTNLVFDPEWGELDVQFLSLTGTDRNCAGGAMPWGSWITCEEPEDITTGRGLHHGWCFEVQATAEPGLQKAMPLKALGRFRHEAVALDPQSGILYLTEDRNDGLLYRFIPEMGGGLSRGKLQAMAVRGKPSADTRNYSPGSKWPVEGENFEVEWIDLEDVEAPKDDLRLRGRAAGAAVFARGEGIHYTPDGIFICCTDGGPSRFGQMFRLRPSGSSVGFDRMDLFLQSGRSDILTNGDNLCPAPWGGLVVCEDLIDESFAESVHVQCVTPEGKVFTIARNAFDKSEFAGCCFSPDGQWLFVNMQGLGKTLAITGPWEKAGVSF